MNRLKLWLFALVVVVAAAASTFVHSRTRGTDALRGIESRVQRAATVTTQAASRLTLHATALAGIAARDAALTDAVKPAPAPAPLPRRKLHLPPPPAPDPAAQDVAVERAAAGALEAAAGELGIAPKGLQLLVATPGALEGRAAAAGDAGALLRAAAAGKTEHGFVRYDGKLWAAAGAPVAGGAALVVFVPVDAGWTRELAGWTGSDVTVVGPTTPTLTTVVAPKDATAIVNAASALPSVVVDVGRLERLDSGLPKAPKVPLLFVAAPAYRALAVPLAGVHGALAVLSMPTRPELAGLAALQWWVLAGLATLLVLALLFSVLVRAAEPAPMVPESLLAAAARIEGGDLDARAPKLAGKVGTVAAALNRALEAAATAQAAVPPPPPPEDLFAKAAKPPEAEPSAFEFPARALAPAAAAAAEPAPELTPEPAPAPEAPLPFAFAPAAPEPAPEPMPAPAAIAAPPDLLQAAARAVAPEASAVDDEQAHWQQVFQEFLRTRTECGEAAEGLTFERFRAKLASNKAALVAKYSCRTVRFQVYVKDGKAALKATPVR